MVGEVPWEQQLSALQPRLQRFFSSRGCGQSTDDLASETIVRLLRVLHGGQAIASLEGYAIGVAKNVLLEHRRGQARAERSLPEDWDPPAPPPVEPPDVGCLERCLATLDPDDRALVLRFFGAAGPSVKNKDVRRDLAAERRMSMNALYLRIRKLRLALQACLEDCAEGRRPGSRPTENRPR